MAAILAINAGSSSLKFALYRAGVTLERQLHGTLERIGGAGARLTWGDERGPRSSADVEAGDHAQAAQFLTHWLEEREGMPAISATGHRIVHGMHRTAPELVTAELLTDLRRIIAYDPDHLPFGIDLIEALQRCYPERPQVACFDTAFHGTLPPAVRILPIPRRYYAMGIQRYGFHGLSCTSLMEQLEAACGNRARGRLVLAHLGSGASLTAVRDGRSMDTTMGFTPAGGIPMGTRPGDMDPGVAHYLMSEGGLTAEDFSRVINHESGLLGISETSADMRDLLENQVSDPRAAEAVEVFCYQARKAIGALAAALGGIETLVFSGGVGENSAEVRGRICAELRFLGIEVDEDCNARNSAVISPAGGRVTVRVMRTDEELTIARQVRQVVFPGGLS